MQTSRTERFAKFLRRGGAKHLSPREENVASRLADGMTLEEVGKEDDVTRERIRQISDRINRIIKRVEADESAPSRRKETTPKEMSDCGLVVNLLSAARLAWEVRVKQGEKGAKASLEYKKERRLQRELMRRLADKEKKSLFEVVVLGDGVGTSKIVGPFFDPRETSDWSKRFWELFEERFGKDQITPISTPHILNTDSQPTTPEKFVNQLPDQDSKAEFFL